MVNAANLALSPYFGTTLSLMSFKIPSASLDDIMDDDVHKEQDEASNTTNKIEEEEGKLNINDDEYEKMNTFNDIDSEDEDEEKVVVEEEEEEELTDSNQYIRIIPHIDDTSKPVIFDVLKWKKKASTKPKIVRLGRCPPSTINNDYPIDILFLKSKVVSRYHCDIGYENGKVYVRDVGSSSGTYLNHQRLCGSHKESDKIFLKDGDIIQLGVQYQDGIESFHRCVKLKVEMNYQDLTKTSFYQQVMKKYQWHHQPYQQKIPSIQSSPTNTTIVPIPSTSSNIKDKQQQNEQLKFDHNIEEEEEDYCSICLDNLKNNNSITQHSEFLFVSPCGHLFHHSCIQPLILSIYPGFICALCRFYANLETDPFYTTANFQQQQSLFNQQLKQKENSNRKEKSSKSQRQRRCKTLVFPFNYNSSASSSNNNGLMTDENSSTHLFNQYQTNDDANNNNNIYPYQINLYTTNRNQQQQQQQQQQRNHHQLQQETTNHRRLHSVIDKIRHVYERRKSFVL
ncbi:unnamed protein product [Cunninghamella blakesleeana]